MKRTFVVEIEDALKGAEDDIEELERKWGAEEIEHKCHNCEHYSKMGVVVVKSAKNIADGKGR